MRKISDVDKPSVDGAPDAADKPRSRTTRRTRKSEKNGQIDLSIALEAPIKLRSDDRHRNVSAFEAVLLQHTRKSLVEKSIASIKFVVAQAEKYHLIRRPPPRPQTCATFTVPKGLPEDVEREIFKFCPEGDSMSRIFGILRRYYNGRRK